MIKKIRELSQSPTFRKKITYELMSNGVAWACALLTSQLLKSFLFVPKIENGFGVFNNHQRVKVSSTTFEILSWVIVFVVGLIVFTVVEHYAEKHLFKNYFKEKEERLKV
jgi:hypothetical protein